MSRTFTKTGKTDRRPRALKTIDRIAWSEKSFEFVFGTVAEFHVTRTSLEKEHASKYTTRDLTRLSRSLSYINHIRNKCMGLDEPDQVVRKTSIANSINYPFETSFAALMDFSIFH